MKMLLSSSGETQEKQPEKSRLVVCDTDITGTEQGPSDLSVGCLLTVECALFPR